MVTKFVKDIVLLSSVVSVHFPCESTEIWFDSG